MRRITKTVLVVLVAMLLTQLVASAVAGGAPVITTLVEGRDAQQDRAVLLVVGTKVSKFSGFELSTMNGAFVGEIERALKTKSMVVLTLPETLSPGQYLLTLYFKGVPQAQSFYFTDGGAMPGRIGIEALNSGLVGDLDDAETLDGWKLSQLRNADGLNAGSLSTDRFSAYEDLEAEGKVGPGSDATLSRTDHGHADLATLDHGHGDLAKSDHGHADLAKSGHEHKIKWGPVLVKIYPHTGGDLQHNAFGTAHPGTVIVGITRDGAAFKVFYRTIEVE